jgi:glyoxylase-like metal-dependent hydrolase (beta-lactamase superfamily II)
MAHITPLDMRWTGRPQAVAAVLLQSSDQHAILDPGPASTVDTLRNELSARGLSVRDLHAIFLTHIHLDHAGATGALLRENPNLRVYVHSKGAPHLIDPSKLLASAGRLWGDDLPKLFGHTQPVPQQNVQLLEGGETLPFGDSKLEVIYTPGHASHHVTYFDRDEGVAFVGDTAGIRISNGPYIMPAAPPPDIDVTLWDESFRAILERKPARLFLTHFGFGTNPEEHLATFRDRLHHWTEITAKAASSAASDEEALKLFVRETSAEMSRHLTPEAVEAHAITAGLPLSFLGLSRYLRKRAERAAG